VLDGYCLKLILKIIADFIKLSKTISYPGIQDEVEAARESCMEEECERVEAEIEKEKVHNENRLLKVGTLRGMLLQLIN